MLSKCLLQHDYAAFNLDFHLDFIHFSLVMMVIIDYWIEMGIVFPTYVAIDFHCESMRRKIVM